MIIEIPYSHFYYFNFLKILRRISFDDALSFLFNNIQESSDDWISSRYSQYNNRTHKIKFEKVPLAFNLEVFLKKIQGLPKEMRPVTDGLYTKNVKFLSDKKNNIVEVDGIKFYDFKENRNRKRILPIFNLVKDLFPFNITVDEYGSFRDIGSQYYRLVNEHELNFMPTFGQTAMDVGCYIGHRALAMRKLVGKSGLVYAIEAVDENFELLKKNISENNFNNIIPVKSVVDNFPKKTTLYSRQKGSMAHGLRKFELIEDPSAIDLKNVTSLSSEVQTTTLNNLILDLKIENIDMMHISVTGHEKEVLDGLGQSSEIVKNIRVSCPYTRNKVSGIKIANEVLNKYGYKIIRTHGSASCASLG